jgi:serine protease
MRVRSALRCGAVAAVVALAAIPAITASAAQQPGPVRLVVTLHGATPSRAALQADVRSLRVDAVQQLGHGLAAVTVRTDDARAAAEALDASSRVADAAPDRRFTASSTPAPVSAPDPWFPEQWDLWDARSTVRAGGFGVDASRAWTATMGDPDVVVAVLDTGITAHPDLAGASIVPGYDFVSQTGGVGSGDGDGWDGDPSDPGDACAALGQGSSWHGTFVTGEIVAQRGRSGVVGEASRVSVEPVRVLGPCGGSEADSIAAIEWSSGGSVQGVPPNPHPAQVVSMSLGSQAGACSGALQTAIDDAIGRGSVVVAAAGNDGSTMSGTSPANCAGVISVVATTRTGALAGYSNRGDSRITPSISAPGGSDADPVIGDTWTSAGAFAAAGDTAAIAAEEGTSMATPLVSGAIALLLSVHPGLHPADVLQRLGATATPFPVGSTCTRARCGAGIVDAGGLLGAKQVFLHASATRITGGARVGTRVKAAAGSWRPAPDRVRYRWLRDGRPIARATGRTYVLRARDAGHRIAVRVQVSRARTSSAVAMSPAVHVSR